MTRTEELNMSVYSLNGAQVASQKSVVHAGTNTIVMDVQSSLKPGVYLLLVKNNKGQQVYRSKLVKTN